MPPKNKSKQIQARQAQKPFFRAALQPDGTLELLVYEEIGYDWWDGGGVTANAIKQKIDAAGNFSKIRMRINSPGGDAFEGIAIYNLIRAEKKPVEVCVDGIAASAASIIAMCGDDIIMGPNAMMMIHNAWAFCAGEAADMRKTAEALDKISGAIAQTYVARTKKDLDAITALMDAETWMTAQECIAEGFATQIVEEAAGESASALAMAKRFKALSKMKKVPASLKPKASDACQCSCESCVDGDCEDCDNPDCDDTNCTDCPMQTEASASAASDLSEYEARAAALTKRAAASA